MTGYSLIVMLSTAVLWGVVEARWLRTLGPVGLPWSFFVAAPPMVLAWLGPTAASPYMTASGLSLLCVGLFASSAPIGAWLRWRAETDATVKDLSPLSMDVDHAADLAPGTIPLPPLPSMELKMNSLMVDHLLSGQAITLAGAQTVSLSLDSSALFKLRAAGIDAGARD